MSFSIKTRLLVVVGATGMIAAAIAGLGVSALDAMRDRTASTMNHDGAIAKEAAGVRSAVLGLRRFEKDMFLNAGDAKKISEYREKHASELGRLDAHMAALDGLELDAEDRARLNEMEGGRVAYAAAVHAIVQQMQSGAIATPQAANAALSGAKDAVRSLEKHADEWAQSGYANMDAAVVELDAYALSARIRLLALAGFVIIAGLIAASWAARTILQPLQRLSLRMQDIASGDGDLTRHLPEDRRDEFGAVAISFNSFLRKMSLVIVDVRHASAQVRMASQHLTQASGSVSSASQTQASSLEEAAASLEEISAGMKRSIESASQAEQASSAARSTATSGGEVLGDAVAAMQGITTSSRQIGQIIGTIDEIAFQTNLLALNAAVEAARAGEQGRGFAVVASEVRALAQRSAAAAKEIRELIRDSEIKVSAGAELVERSGKTLHGIVAGAQRVGDLIGEIAASSVELSTAVEHVGRAVSQIDSSIQSTASQAEELHATSERMSEEASRLDALVGRFKVATVGTPETVVSKHTFVEERSLAAAA